MECQGRSVVSTRHSGGLGHGAAAPSAFRPSGDALSRRTAGGRHGGAAAPLVKPRSAGYLPHGSEVPCGPHPAPLKGLTIHPAQLSTLRNSSRTNSFSYGDDPRLTPTAPPKMRHWRMGFAVAPQ